jgi:hypothetical protein
LGVIAALNKSALVAYENIRNVYNKFLKEKANVFVYTDGGSENLSVTEMFMLSKKNITHRICQTNGFGSNSMIEALIKKIKQCFIYPNTYSGFDDFKIKLSDAIIVYAGQMPLAALDGKTPDEAFEGVNPFSVDVESLIKQAAIERRNINRSSDCF